ncbi:hypothetical protein [Streptomyces sp. BPTC-684]|uniref:hypothetical protein n=1 Tax=Streptomyces sp. BPTC-684 TaxID=3043734 RepID=UPI0024B1E305|nr:hypothetical protein [Streptomyces sp. BPTC-684]WHM37890.1 hypothetical protein QIY60_13880 [Streptomyces sp. BPTC-684]
MTKTLPRLGLTVAALAAAATALLNPALTHHGNNDHHSSAITRPLCNDVKAAGCLHED